MLTTADAALFIGDPALLALEDRARIESTVGPASGSISRTNGALAPACPGLPLSGPSARMQARTSHPGNSSTTSSSPATNGLAHIDALVEEWTPRIAIPPATIRHYLTHNIHYEPSPDCIAAIELFRTMPPKQISFLHSDSLHFL